MVNFKYFFFTEVILAIARAVDFKVSCSQIPRRAFTGIRTHDPLVESDVLSIRPHDAPQYCFANKRGHHPRIHACRTEPSYMYSDLLFNLALICSITL
jgi:hypothetical protein